MQKKQLQKNLREQPELVAIHCRTVSDDVRKIAAFVRSRQGLITGKTDQRQYEIGVEEIKRT